MKIRLFITLTLHKILKRFHIHLYYFIPIQTNHDAFYVKSELWPFTKLLNKKTETLVISLFRKPYTVHACKFIYKTRPKLADDTAILYCAFNDPWESYCPWNFIIFTRKSLKLINYLSLRDGTNWNVVNDLWPWQWVKVNGQGHLNSMKIMLFYNSFTTWGSLKILYAISVQFKLIIMHLT
jgi:hypothetical protein